MIDTFEAVNGRHPGFRRNHSKGLCVIGDFTSNGAGARLSKAQLFQPGQISPVMGRFAVGSGMPFQPDGPKVVRSLAISRMVAECAERAEMRVGDEQSPMLLDAMRRDFAGRSFRAGAAVPRRLAVQARHGAREGWPAKSWNETRYVLHASCLACRPLLGPRF